MATINHGVMGGFSGAVGTVVGGSWNGIDYMRARPTDRKDAKSIAQLDQRVRFKRVIEFLKPLKSFLPVGFKTRKAGQSAFNAAASCNLPDALTGDYPNYRIDFSKAIVSQGALPGALNPGAHSAQAGLIEFHWENNSFAIDAMANDKAVLVVYNPGIGRVVARTGGNSRSSGHQVLALPENFAGHMVHCYIAFQKANQTLISNSQYAGSISIMS